MKDKYGNEFVNETEHCWNCEHYKDIEDSSFSWCKKNNSCISIKQLKTMFPVTCVKFSNRYKGER